MSALADNAPLLRLDGLRLRYLGTSSYALRDVDLALPPETTGLIFGGEGAGRSSLLHVAAGLAPRLSGGQLEGEVELNVTGMRRRLQDVGPEAWSDEAAIVLEDPVAQRSGARATVREEVAFGLECRGVPRREMASRVEEALAALGLTPLAARDPDTLSGGQATRLAVAATWVQSPRLLLLDETDDALDAAGRARLRWLLSAQARRGGSTLWAPAREEAADEAGIDEFGAREDGRGLVASSPAWMMERGRSGASGSLEQLWLRPDVLASGVEPPLRARADQLVSRIEAADSEGVAAEAILVPGLRHEIDPEDLKLDRQCGLRVRDVSVSYPAGVFGLRGATLEAEPGRILALVGANGGGKTTLLRAMLGLAPVVEGAIHVDGQDMAGRSVAQRARYMGLAFQRPGDQLFSASVRRDVAFGPRNLGYSKPRGSQLIETALRVCGLTEDADKHPLDLGRGGRRRAALAGVLAMATPIVALDEPDHGLDMAGRRWLRALLLALRAAGRTVLLVSHDLDLVGAVADQVGLLAEGELRAFDTAPKVLRDEGLLRSAGLAPAPSVTLARHYGISPAPVHGDALLEALARRGR